MANIARKTLSAVAVASLLAAGTFVGTSAVNGGVPFLPSAGAQTAAAIDGIPSSANLEINKRLGLTGTARDDGTQIAPEEVPGEAAEGIEFSIFPVDEDDIDLTILEGWQAADDRSVNEFFTGAGLNSYNTLDRTRLGEERTTETSAAGIARFNDVPTGLYLVVEEANPTLPNGQAVAPAAPFLVTLPMTDPIERQTWLDTVYVYPKGQAVAAPRKTITDPFPTGDGVDLTGSSLGELIGYEIAADVPGLGGDNTLNGFSVTDKLPAELGAPQSVVVTLGGTPLTPVDDYGVRNWSVGAGDDAQEVLLVELTDAGLAQLGAGGGELVVSFNAVLEATPQANLENQAWVSPTALGVADGWDPEAEGASPGTPSNATRSIYGEINIQKTGQGEDSTGLPGAIFELHRCDAEGDLAGDSLPIQVGGTTTWTTEEDGSALISGVHLANVTDQDDLAGTYEDLWEGNGTQFCLVETQAPDGYALLPEPVGVTLPYDADTLNLVSVDQPIENVEANAGFSLPLTGGMGIWLILGGGILLLLIAAAYYLVTRKRDNA